MSALEALWLAFKSLGIGFGCTVLLIVVPRIPSLAALVLDEVSGRVALWRWKRRAWPRRIR